MALEAIATREEPTSTSSVAKERELALEAKLACANGAAESLVRPALAGEPLIDSRASGRLVTVKPCTGITMTSVSNRAGMAYSGARRNVAVVEAVKDVESNLTSAC